jgi:hypothetical protein
MAPAKDLAPKPRVSSAFRHPVALGAMLLTSAVLFSAGCLAVQDDRSTALRVKGF